MVKSRQKEQEDFDYFAEKYSRPRSHVARRVEIEILGHEVGLSGYTTVEQAEALCESLSLRPSKRLLDLGAGRGWPGLHLAERSRCTLFSTDIPFEALKETKANVVIRKLNKNIYVLAADGRQLPFTAAYFDAIVHADVFCWIADKLSVMRECSRVLKPGGRMAGYTIHTPSGLNPQDQIEAAELGPSDVNSAEMPDEIAEAVNLQVIKKQDVTETFRSTCQEILRVREKHQGELRREEGDEAYEEEQNKKRTMLTGIKKGLLIRSLHVSVKE